MSEEYYCSFCNRAQDESHTESCPTRDDEGEYVSAPPNALLPTEEVEARELAAVMAAIADPGKLCGFRSNEGMVKWQARAAIAAMRALAKPGEGVK